MSQDNKNYFDLCNDILEELYYEKVDTFEELEELTEGRKVKKELNRALVYICNNEHSAWQFRDVEQDLFLVPYMNQYDLPNGFISYMKYPEETLLLTYVDDHKTFPYSTGLPVYYWFDNNKIKLYPVPTECEANKRISIHYYTNDYAKDCRGVFKPEMTEECDEPIIPRHHRNILVYKVCADWRANVNDPKSVHYDVKFKEAYRALLSDQRLSADLPNGLDLSFEPLTYTEQMYQIFKNPYTINRGFKG